MDEITTKSGQRGADLDDVLREIMEVLSERYGWNSSKLRGRATGMSQRNYNRIENKRGGFTLKHVSHLCAEIQVSPIELLQMHPRYAPKNREGVTFVTDQLWSRFRAALTPAEQEREVSRIEDRERMTLREIGDRFIDEILQNTKPPKRQAIRRSRARGSGRKPHPA